MTNDKQCACELVKPNENGTWQCMICRRKFFPVDQVEYAGEQKPAIPINNENFKEATSAELSD